MSRVLALADAIKARLEATPALEGIPVIVDRQRNIAALVTGAVNKSKGNCITILFEGFDVPDANTGGPRVRGRFVVRCYARPVMEKALAGACAVFADDVAEAAAKALHHWVPEHAHNFGELTVAGCDLVPDPTWLIYELEIQSTLQL